MKQAILNETMKSLTFGTELEYTGITRHAAAEAIKNVVGGHAYYAGTSYCTWEVKDTQGRIWKCMRDGSLGYDGGCEVVTPILKYSDIETLQEVVRALRHAGAQTPSCTSQHVHVGAKDWTARQIANFSRIWYKQEAVILKALGTLRSRLEHYTKPTEKSYIERLEKAKPETKDELNKAWFGEFTPVVQHYEPHRYRAVNLNNIWRTGTVEVRAFNGTTHAGQVKANIVLVLAIAAMAINAKAASTNNPREYNEASAKYDMRVFLLHLGLSGDEFKNVREHLLKRLPGSASRKTEPRHKTENEGEARASSA